MHYAASALDSKVVGRVRLNASAAGDTMRVVVSACLLAIGAALIVSRALAPLYGRFDDAECRAAYGRARTIHDSVRVDLHPALAQDGGRSKGYCGALRARHVESLADLSILPHR